MIFKEITKEARELLKATASNNEAARETFKAIAAELGQVLRKAVFRENLIDGVYSQIELAPGAEAKFPLDLVAPGTEGDFVAFTMPKQGMVPERHVEGDEVYVPTYKIANAIDWDIDHAKDARWDLIGRALEIFKAGFTKKLNDDGWHVILAAGNSAGYMVRDTAATAGVFTPALIYRMKTTQRRRSNDGDLTDLYISSEAMEDLRNWSTTSIVDLGSRVQERIFVAESDPALVRVNGVNIHEMRELGEGSGGTPEEYQDYFVNTLGGALGAGGDVELVVGLDLGKDDSFVMPVRTPLEVFETGELLHRQGRQGFYGWMRVGFAAIDNRRVLLGSF